MGKGAGRYSTLHHWCKEYAKAGEQAFPGSGNPPASEEELRRLRRENDLLRQERDISKKSDCHLFAQPGLSYPFIEQHAKLYPVSTMCRVLQVSVSGYYDWRHRELSAHEREDGELAREIHRLFHAFRGVYGSSTKKSRARNGVVSEARKRA